MTRPAHEEKGILIEEIRSNLEKAKSFVIFEYKGMNASHVENFRKSVIADGGNTKVYKNTLVARAADQLGMTELKSILKGPNAIAFAFEDEMISAKHVGNTAKDIDSVVIKGGYFEGKFVDATQVAALASLPNRDGLLSMLLSVLQAPMRNLAYSLSQVADQKEA